MKKQDNQIEQSKEKENQEINSQKPQAENQQATVEKQTENQQVDGEEPQAESPRCNKIKWSEIVKYTLFSISAGVIQIGVFTLLNEVLLVNLDMEYTYWLDYLPALSLSVVWNFSFNRKFTFKSANNVPLAMTKVVMYYVAFIPISTLVGDLLDRAGVFKYAILIGTMLVNFVAEFFYSKFFVFSPKYDIKKK